MNSRITVPKIRRARRLHQLRRRYADAALVQFWGRASADYRREILIREILDDVAAGRSCTIYHDAEHTRPLAVVVPYQQYERQKEALQQLEAGE